MNPNYRPHLLRQPIRVTDWPITASFILGVFSGYLFLWVLPRLAHII